MTRSTPLLLILATLVAPAFGSELRVFVSGIGSPITMERAVVEFDDTGFPVATPIPNTGFASGLALTQNRLFLGEDDGQISRFKLDGSNRRDLIQLPFSVSERMRLESSRNFLYAAGSESKLYRLDLDGKVLQTIQPMSDPQDRVF
ncbi:MAG: hypothetical protein AAGF97_08215, partial [Planctomycetota bacterium]